MGVIQITLRISGTRKMLLIPKTCTIRELFSKVKQAIEDQTADFYLICDGEQLEEDSGETIDSVGISHGSVVDFCQRQRGGSGRRLQPLPGKIGLSRDPCCITYDDDPLEYRAQMPCGCVISVDAMKTHTEEELRKGRHKIQCPNCRQNWALHLVRHVLSSVLSADQLESIGARVNDNYLKNSAFVQQCPSCNNFCEHTDRHENRIRCRFCTRQQGGAEFVFCWACLKPWREALSFTCGNPGCTGKDARTRYLQECATKTIGQVSGVPSVRRCEKCSQLVNHIDACKHMTCKCGFNFCFVCLKPQINGEWQCGLHSSPCEVAPRQT